MFILAIEKLIEYTAPVYSREYTTISKYIHILKYICIIYRVRKRFLIHLLLAVLDGIFYYSLVKISL